mgnify:CR=1 FL=1
MDNPDNIILINPVGCDGSSVKTENTNVGLASLDAYLKQHQITSTIINSTDIDQYRDRSDVFGISVMDHSYEHALELSESLKDKTLIWGGWTATALAEKILTDHAPVDYVILREGEERLRALIESFQRPDAFDKIDGIAFRDSKGKVTVRAAEKHLDMDILPFPEERAVLSDRVVFVELSRGCYGGCRFCQDVSVMRYKSAERLAEEFQHWLKKGYTEFYVGNANSLANGNLLSQMADRIEALGLHVRLHFVGRPDDVLRNADSIEKLFASPLIDMAKIEIGIEADSQRMLDILGRGTTPEINRSAIRRLEELREKYSPDTGLHCNMILFSHYSITMEELIQNIRFIGDFAPHTRNGVGGHLFGIAGTPIWDELHEKGFPPLEKLGMRIIRSEFSDPDVKELYRRIVTRLSQLCKKDPNILSLTNVLHDEVMSLYNFGDLEQAVKEYPFE